MTANLGAAHRWTLLLGALALLALRDETAAQTASFTYQGRLSDGGAPANGQYDLTFQLYDSATGTNQIGTTITNASQSVAVGLFTVSLNFGASAFDGSDRWLQIGVRTNGGLAFVSLGPRSLLPPRRTQSLRTQPATCPARFQQRN